MSPALAFAKFQKILRNTTCCHVVQLRAGLLYWREFVARFIDPRHYPSRRHGASLYLHAILLDVLNNDTGVQTAVNGIRCLMYALDALVFCLNAELAIPKLRDSFEVPVWMYRHWCESSSARILPYGSSPPTAHSGRPPVAEPVLRDADRCKS